MTLIAIDLKPIVERQSRKHLKQYTSLLKKEVTAWKKEVASLQQQVSSLRRALEQFESRGGAAHEKPSSVFQPFSPEQLCAHRAKLGLSAQDYAILAGVSALSIYKWESGKTRPVPVKRSLLAEVQRLNKSAALERLEKLKARGTKR